MSDGNVSTAISAKPQLHTLESLKKMDASVVKAAYEDIVEKYAESLKNFGYTEKQVKGYVSEALKTKTSENRISSVMRLQEEMGLGDVTLHEEQNPLQDVTFDDKIMEEKSAKSKSSLIDIEKIAPLLKTKPDTAFFWSGNTNGIGGMDVAANIAKKNGGVTLEMVLDRQNIRMPEFNLNDSNSVEIWQKSSADYAKQATGVVRAVIGNSINPKGVWNSIELPELKRNQNVTKIIIIDPQTLKETVIFSR